MEQFKKVGVIAQKKEIVKNYNTPPGHSQKKEVLQAFRLAPTSAIKEYIDHNIAAIKEHKTGEDAITKGSKDSEELATIEIHLADNSRHSNVL